MRIPSSSWGSSSSSSSFSPSESTSRSTLETADDRHTHPLAFCLGTSRGTLWARSTGSALNEENRSGGCKPVRVGTGVERNSPGDRGDLEVQLVLAVPKRGDPHESCAVNQLGPTDSRSIYLYRVTYRYSRLPLLALGKDMSAEGKNKQPKCGLSGIQPWSLTCGQCTVQGSGCGCGQRGSLRPGSSPKTAPRCRVPSPATPPPLPVLRRPCPNLYGHSCLTQGYCQITDCSVQAWAIIQGKEVLDGVRAWCQASQLLWVSARHTQNHHLEP